MDRIFIYICYIVTWIGYAHSSSLKNNTDRNKRLSGLRRKTETRRNSTGPQTEVKNRKGTGPSNSRLGLYKNESIAQFKASKGTGGSSGKDK